MRQNGEMVGCKNQPGYPIGGYPLYSGAGRYVGIVRSCFKIFHCQRDLIIELAAPTLMIHLGNH